ncbi:MAG: YqgE/AlgH family protein [Serratia symbiotica]|nr:YqgE/AlgH family protein [Serratia symbiotica]
MNLQHHFLIAMPSLQASCFTRSVIYICEHNEEGAMGLVINKPLEQCSVAMVLNKLKIMPQIRDPAINLEKPVFAGGPLADDCGFILHTPCQGFGYSMAISEQTMITTSKDVLETLGTPEQPDNVLVALGYAGWEVGQLEQEVLENVWLTLAADTDTLFHTPIAKRWRKAANRLGVDIHSIVNHVGHA